MFAIETYFIGPSNVRGSRIAARVMDRGTGWRRDYGARRVVLGWDHTLNPAENHRYAALTLAEKLGWAGEWVEAGGDDGASVWVNTKGMSDRFKARGDMPLEQRLERGRRPAHIAAVTGP